MVAVNEEIRDTVIEGNTIGLAADGVTPIVTRSGIVVSPLTSMHHALSTLITSNHIASVETTGVFVASLESGVTITGNSIHNNGALGIDLAPGANHQQNFPALISATTTGSAVMVQGTLDSSPSEQFTVEIFTSPACDPSGFGEGAVFLGSTMVTTDGAGHGTFFATLPATVAVGTQATATATRLSTGDTSEFSACAAVTSGSTQTPTNTPTPSAVISGTVLYGNAIGAPTLRPVSNVLISGVGATSMSTFTDFPDGIYSLSGFGSGSYTVTPTKTNGVNGISSFDAAKIAQHAAGAN